MIVPKWEDWPNIWPMGKYLIGSKTFGGDTYLFWKTLKKKGHTFGDG